MEKKYKPILFSTEMVQANLEGRKRMTRRTQGLEIPNQDPENYIFLGWDKNIAVFKSPEEKYRDCKPKFIKGDILWVRETTKVGAWNDEDYKIAFDYAASPELKKTPWVEYQDIDRFEEIHLKTIEELDKMGFEADIDKKNERVYYWWNPGESPLKWKPAIYMPKEAARIFLEVTNVRCERLWDISEEDAIAEGMNPEQPATYLFAALWKRINGTDSWKANPWVWVYEFKKTEKPSVWPQ